MFTNSQEKQKMLTTQQVLDRYGIHRNTLYKWRKWGLPHIRVGKIIRYEVAEVDEWLEKFKNRG